MNKTNILDQISLLDKPYIIYRSKKGFCLYTDFSKKIILTKKNITSFLKKTNQKQKKLKKTDLYVGFFGYEILNDLINVKIPKQKETNFPKGIFYKPEKIINLNENLQYQPQKINKTYSKFKINIYRKNYTKIFNKFKRNPIYRQILEHTTYKLSLEYLKKTNQNILNQINKFMINDNTGDPIKFYYKTLNKNVSPGTSRSLKVCSDIEKYFVKKFGNIVEIGCGYGGQYIILDKYFNIKRYTLFDLPQVNKLIEKNLLNYNLK